MLDYPLGIEIRGFEAVKNDSAGDGVGGNGSEKGKEVEDYKKMTFTLEKSGDHLKTLAQHQT